MGWRGGGVAGLGCFFHLHLIPTARNAVVGARATGHKWRDVVIPSPTEREVGRGRREALEDGPPSHLGSKS